MKEKILTNAVLGSYASSPDNDAMEFTWNDNCHNNNHGCTDYAYSCDNTNNYNESKVKEFLEGTYINTLGTNNLKEINGYKIRLITLEELQQNFGWTELNAYATSGDNSSVPTWVYRDFTVDKIAYGYWTMTPKPSPSNNVWFMSTSEQLNVYYGHDYGNTGVRPVINLLKSAIE